MYNLFVEIINGNRITGKVRVIPDHEAGRFEELHSNWHKYGGFDTPEAAITQANRVFLLMTNAGSEYELTSDEIITALRQWQAAKKRIQETQDQPSLADLESYYINPIKTLPREYLIGVLVREIIYLRGMNGNNT